MRQSQEFHVGGGVSGSGHLSPFNASLSAPGSDRSFATFPVDEVEFSNSAVLEIDQDLHLSCVSCFSQLAASAVTSKEFEVLITGNPDLHIKGLPTYSLDIHKTMKLQGMVYLHSITSRTNFYIQRKKTDTLSKPGYDAQGKDTS